MHFRRLNSVMHFPLKSAMKNEILLLRIMSLGCNKKESAFPILQIPIGGFFPVFISGDFYVLRAGFFPVHIYLERRKW